MPTIGGDGIVLVVWFWLCTAYDVAVVLCGAVCLGIMFKDWRKR